MIMMTTHKDIKFHAFYGIEPSKKHNNDTRRPTFKWITHFFQKTHSWKNGIGSLKMEMYFVVLYLIMEC